MHDPWTLYWQADRLDSADAVQSKDDYHAITNCWGEFAALIDEAAEVLDLATGNGTVPAALLAARDTLRITGVDKADIDPLQYLESPGALGKVDFRGGVDICALPFDDQSFDALTSQFGIEYSTLEEAVYEAARVLRPGGHVQFLLHCDTSEVVKPAADRRAEMEALLADGGLLMSLRSHVAGDVPQSQLEAAGRTHLDADGPTTPGISGQIFGGINQVINHMQGGDRRAAAELCETMIIRLTADRDRLAALEAAAMDGKRLNAFVAQLKSSGIDKEATSELRTSGQDPFVIGWLYRGRKR